jgi:hypothetical protein
VSEKILPLSAGLLISMALRNDHAFAMKLDYESLRKGFVDGEASERVVEARQRIALDNMLEAYQKACKGLKIDPQIYEELTGDGFYNSSIERSYLVVVVSASVMQYAMTLVENNKQDINV